METIDRLQRRIETTEDLGSVVRTMKALAAVNIRHYEKAVESLADYRRTVELGLQAVLRQFPERVVRAGPAHRLRTGVVAFGSDQGMCGPLNDRVAACVAREVEGRAGGEFLFLAVGGRMASRLGRMKFRIDREIRLPGSMPGITQQVQEVLLAVDEWEAGRRIDRLLLVHAVHESRSSYRPEARAILPLDEAWLAELRGRRWPTDRLPLVTMDPGALFSSLLRQYLFIGVYRAFAESLASENASRLASMRRAEDNIAERLSDLRRDYHQQRQAAVTGELLDIVSAFEILGGGPASPD